jgi:GAF domain-containing protein
VKRDDDLTAALTEFARRLAESQTVEGVLRSLGDLCTQLLSVTGVGVLLLEDGDVVVGTTNSELGDVAEGLEAALQQGPCVDAIEAVEASIVPDLAAEAGRWPAFGPRALEAGVRSVHGLPMTGAGEVVGALNVVHAEPLRLSDEQLATAQVLADVAVSYILAARLHEERGRLADQLQHALDSRVVIEQAKGMLAERYDIDVRSAFDRLRQHARASQRTVRAVATEVVDGTLRL